MPVVAHYVSPHNTYFEPPSVYVNLCQNNVLSENNYPIDFHHTTRPELLRSTSTHTSPSWQLVKAGELYGVGGGALGQKQLLFSSFELNLA